MANVSSAVRNALEWVLVVVIALAATFVIHTFVAEPFYVPTESMVSTIEPGDYIMAEKVTLELGMDVEAGDIVVFRNPDTSQNPDHEMLVKRVVAVAGQTVDLRDGRVYVDGAPLDEPYATGETWPLAASTPDAQVSYPYTVPEGCVWLMGDNRENSADSRYFGPVSTESIVGVGVFRFWPLGRIGGL